MTVLTEWNLSLNVDDVLRGQGADPNLIRRNKPRLIAIAEHACTEGLCLLHPVALIYEVAVHEQSHELILLEGGVTLTGPLVGRHLAGAQRVIAAVCTIGSEMEETVNHFLDKDPLYALALDGLGNAAVEILAQQVCLCIGKKIQAEGLQVSTPLSPGSSEWSVDVGQPQIFALLEPTQVGISLTSGGMMLPKKSISFIVGIGPKMSQANMCDVCDLKGTCRYCHD
jgi:hypothetical protein